MRIFISRYTLLNCRSLSNVLCLLMVISKKLCLDSYKALPKRYKETKEDNINVSKLGSLQKEAVFLAQEAGYK